MLQRGAVELRVELPPAPRGARPWRASAWSNSSAAVRRPAWSRSGEAPAWVSQSVSRWVITD
ncbi:MAG: hypothetical protein IPN17_38520 [Deltaproteobacteria bacterium]|nr:hypothetical protein [Deltaproteobacteria bacterium]